MKIKKEKLGIRMSFIGKAHEISLYGLISATICLVTRQLSINVLLHTAIHISSFTDFFVCYLFWASVLFVPIAIIGAFSTKHVDGGEGLLFASNNIVVIIFAHIAEEMLGLISTPFWFLKDLFTKELDGSKIFDYITYAVEVILIVIGMVLVF